MTDSIITEYSREYNSFVAPFTFSPETTLEQVHDCFVTLRLPVAFVTKQGRVMGTITRQKVMELASLGDAGKIDKVVRQTLQGDDTEELGETVIN